MRKSIHGQVFASRHNVHRLRARGMIRVGWLSVTSHDVCTFTIAYQARNAHRHGLKWFLYHQRMSRHNFPCLRPSTTFYRRRSLVVKSHVENIQPLHARLQLTQCRRSIIRRQYRDFSCRLFAQTFSVPLVLRRDDTSR